MSDTDLLRYPIGKYVAPQFITSEQLNLWIHELEQLPAQLDITTKNLTEEELETAYRPGGWTLRQVVHHLPDSHLNAYMRFKFAVTEDNPVIKPYNEERWAECGEAKSAPVALSISLLDNLHRRWAAFLKTLTEKQFKRSYIHPEHNKSFPLNSALGEYVWHGKHHLAHISEAIKRNNW